MTFWQRVADALDAAGLVRYTENPRHRRARLVELTAQGRGVLSRIQADQRPWADALGAAIGERHLAQTNTLLDRVLAKMAAARPASRSKESAEEG